MVEHSNVVDRADSLMRRRRSFVATLAGQQETASAPEPAPEDDDLPVLTEVVSAEEDVGAAPDDPIDETQVSLLAADIAHAIGQQMAFELPSLLEAAFLMAGEELRAGITSAVDAALRDFIARRKQLRLPLDEPNASD